MDPFLDQGESGDSADEEPSSGEEDGLNCLDHGIPFLWKWGELAPSPVGYRWITGSAASMAHIHSFTSAIA